ncbi:MAG: sigma 54-interacting transcriptional regulator [Bacillota bacterium]
MDSSMLFEIANCIEEAIHVVDRSGRTIFYNNAAAKMDGLQVEEVVGRHLLSVYPSLTRETSTLLRVMSTGTPILNQQQTYITQRGTAITTVNSTFPLYRDNELVGAVEVSKDITKIKELVDTVSILRAELHRQQRKGQCKPSEGLAVYTFESIVGEDPELISLKEAARKAANTSSPVLVWGETGTGKELLVQSIHNASFRRESPFVAQNCSALPETLLEGIFFGTAKGGFTGAGDRPGLFELADGGTLYLDELNSMPIDLQAKLLRVVETGQVRRLGDVKQRSVDVRIISSTNMDPVEAVEKGFLRADLFYRLNVVSLRLPPLRERPGDIPLLVASFIKKFGHVLNSPVKRVAPSVMNVFLRYSWPGNIRELEHTIEGAMNLAQGEQIEAEHLPAFIARAQRDEALIDLPAQKRTGNVTRPLREFLAEVEREYITQALKTCKGNVSRAARLLDIPRSTLQYRISVMNVDPWQ